MNQELFVMKNKQLLILSLIFFVITEPLLHAHAGLSHGTPSQGQQPLIRLLSKEEKQNIYLSAMNSHYFPRSIENPLITQASHAWKELDMDLLIEKLDRTILGIGAAEFKKLMQPITNIKTLKARAAFLQELDNNPELFEQLNNTIKAFSLFENNILHSFDHNSSILRAIYDEGVIESVFEFFGLSNLAAIAHELCSFQSVLASSMIGIGWSIYGLNKEMGHFGHDLKNLKNLKDFHNGSLFVGKPVEMVKKGAHTVWMAYSVFLLLYSGYKMSEWAYTSISIVPLVDDHIVAMAKAFMHLEDLSELINVSPTLKQSSIGKSVTRFFNAASFKPETVQQLISFLTTRLETEVESGPLASVQRTALKLGMPYLMTGSIAAYDLIQQTKSYFLPLFQDLGTLDAYLSIIRLKKEYEEKGIKTTWAQFTDDNQESVANSFSFGSDQNRHAIFTGPHGCGKTTAMKTIAYTTAILGQSILLVPAAKSVFTPLTSLVTYFNIVDSIAEGASSYTAEEDRMEELRTVITNLTPDSRVLALLDEPYSKTVPEVGQDGAYEFGQLVTSVNPQNNLRLLMSTHFEKPSQLEAETSGLIKNLQPEIHELEPGNFHPTFKIIDGAANWWFKNKDQRKRFILWLRHKVSTDQRSKNFLQHATIPAFDLDGDDEQLMQALMAALANLEQQH